ncbi:MAG: hypothetical protein M1298_05440, partial [Chloroflexi bacterium]|nr:hypothetical protein [Chloroflexota bacterium]
LQQLSHSMSELLTLLLHLAITSYLTKPGESCPLILDNLLTQSDSYHKRLILNFLHEISRDRQIILFTHSDSIRQWASETLRPLHPECSLLQLHSLP